MSVENRAKLFSPFSALRGFYIEILTQEQDRLLVPQIILASDREEEIYRLLNGLHVNVNEKVSQALMKK